MAVKASRSTSNFFVEVRIQLGKMKVDMVPMLVMPVSDYETLICMDNLIRLSIVKRTASPFPSTKSELPVTENLESLDQP